MGDEDVETLDVQQLETLEEGDKNKRSRLALALILLLLLLLCVVTTVADVFVLTTPEKREFIIRNAECLQCHPELIPEFNRASVHNPFLKKRCTTCHTKHGELVQTITKGGVQETWRKFRTLIEWLPLRIACEVGAGPAGLIDKSGGGTSQTTTQQRKGADSTLVLPLKELCWMCHGDIGVQNSMAYQHNPFQMGRCTSCHDPHASDFGPLLTQDKRDLCVTCHPIGPEINRAQAHPPAANRYCTSCHHPHASDYKGILVTNQRDLCFTCHPTVAPLSLKAYQHNPFVYDNCTGCHEPHGSDYPPLLDQPQPGLCYKCHPGIQNDFKKPSHHPVGTVKLVCGDCHNPHAADYKFLIDAQDNAFCYECHATAIKATYEPSAHRRVLCVRCHTPHGSYYGPLLIKPNPPLCLDCHNPNWYDEDAPGAPPRNNHPVRPVHYDMYAKKPLTCTTTCHNPHGTSHNYMLRYYSWPFDGRCLICHRLVPGKMVGIDF